MGCFVALFCSFSSEFSQSLIVRLCCCSAVGPVCPWIGQAGFAALEAALICYIFMILVWVPLLFSISFLSLFCLPVRLPPPFPPCFSSSFALITSLLVLLWPFYSLPGIFSLTPVIMPGLPPLAVRRLLVAGDGFVKVAWPYYKFSIMNMIFIIWYYFMVWLLYMPSFYLSPK